MEQTTISILAACEELIYPAYAFFVGLGLILLFAFPVAGKIRDRRLKKHYYLLQLVTFLAALLGAKLAVLVGDLNWPVEPLPDFAMIWYSGRSILGALLFGFLAAETVKPLLNYPLPPNDRFATLLPFSIATGRIGCLIQGCCRGVPSAGMFSVVYEDGIPRHPAQAVEILFNLAVGVMFVLLLRKGLLRGHLFALYLIGYGLFRFWHEDFRDTPKFWHPWSAYQVMALLLAALGVAFLVKRSIWPPAAWARVSTEGPT